MYIPHSKPTLGNTEAKILKDVLASGYLAQGPRVAQLERAVARFMGVNHATATNSGTSALHLTLLAMGIKPGDEVIIPSYVCTAVLNAVNYTGAKPVPADISVDFNLSYESARRRITKRTKAIILPHLFGYPADIDKFLLLGIPLVEDCAQSIGALYKGRKAGTFGKAAIFSFYATKMMTTGYGGMVASNDKRLLDKVRDLRDFDNRDDYKPRFNYQMSDLGAALGIVQLKRLPGFINRRIAIARRYAETTGYYAASCSCYVQPVFHRYIISVVNPGSAIKSLARKGIEAKRPVYQPLHRYLGLPAKDFPVTEAAYKTALSIPIYPSLNGPEVNYLIKNVGQTLKGRRRIIQ